MKLRDKIFVFLITSLMALFAYQAYVRAEEQLSQSQTNFPLASMLLLVIVVLLFAKIAMQNQRKCYGNIQTMN